LKFQLIALAVGMPNRPKLTPTAHANTRVRVLICTTRSDVCATAARPTFALLRPAPLC
jgi:hypothetical protein